MVTDDNKESINLMLQELKIEEKDPHKIIQQLRKIPADKLAASQDKATAVCLISSFGFSTYKNMYTLKF